MGQESANNPDSAWLKESRILFNFLRVSPSYTAAAQYIPSKTNKTKMPLESKQVIKNFKKYGDVQQTRFDDWVKVKGSKLIPKKDTNIYNDQLCSDYYSAISSTCVFLIVLF